MDLCSLTRGPSAAVLLVDVLLGADYGGRELRVELCVAAPRRPALLYLHYEHVVLVRRCRRREFRRRRSGAAVL